MSSLTGMIVASATVHGDRVVGERRHAERKHRQAFAQVTAGSCGACKKRLLSLRWLEPNTCHQETPGHSLSAWPDGSGLRKPPISFA